MIVLFKSFVEAVAENGLQGLAELVPGGGFVFNVLKGTWEKYRQRCDQAAQTAEIQRLAAMSFEQAKEAAIAAAQEFKDPSVRALVEVYLTQVPGSIQRSFKRPDDESGHSLPPNFALQSADDLARLLPPDLPRFKPGDALPGNARFVLDRFLGGGGFGEVWLARHQTFGTANAVKFFKCLDNRDRDLLHEGNVIARIMQQRNPNVVRLIDAHLDGASPWLMYEYVEGGDLGDMIRHYAKLSPADRQDKVVTALQLLARAVGQFHRLDPPIVHRDLKPANILYERAARQLRIIDFGIGGIAARDLLESEKLGTLTRHARLQSYLHGSYTPLYASPQQKAGDPPDPRDDVHALGVIAYQMLTCQMTQGVGSDYAHDLRELGVADGLIDLVGRCTAQRVDRRPRDAREIVDTLGKLAPVLPRPPVHPVVVPPDKRDRYADIRQDERAHLDDRRVKGGDYLERHAERLTQWREAAEEGFTAAQYLYAECFYSGIGVRQNWKNALVWYHKAAENGHVRAQTTLGVMYSCGLGVTKDYVQALAWYRKAAQQNDSEGQCHLGQMYKEGWGVAKDDEQALAWYRKAAEQGDEGAQWKLGCFYEHGQGVAKDDEQALAWYRKAADQGHEDAQRKVGHMYENGQGVTKDDGQAVAWYRKAAEQGHARAQYHLGDMYENGKGIAKDINQAIHWYKKARIQRAGKATAALERLGSELDDDGEDSHVLYEDD